MAALSPHVHYGLHKCFEDVPSEGHRENPLYKRAWALQERLLSQRILIFSGQGLHWECYQPWEGGQKLIKNNPDITWANVKLVPEGSMAEFDTTSTWQTIVEEYSRRSLTFPSDKLPAFSGAAQLQIYQKSQDYLAGLWRPSLLKEMLWSLDSEPKSEGILSKYRAPTWSWASLDEVITYRFLTNGVAKVKTTVIDAQIELKDQLAPFGEVLAGSVTLCGPLLAADVVEKRQIVPYMDIRTDLSSTGLDTCKIWYIMLFINYNSCWGLILVDGKGVDGTCYERIGCFEDQNWNSYKKERKLELPPKPVVERMKDTLLHRKLAGETKPSKTLLQLFKKCSNTTVTII